MQISEHIMQIYAINITSEVKPGAKNLTSGGQVRFHSCWPPSAGNFSGWKRESGLGSDVTQTELFILLYGEGVDIVGFSGQAWKHLACVAPLCRALGRTPSQ